MAICPMCKGQISYLNDYCPDCGLPIDRVSVSVFSPEMVAMFDVDNQNAVAIERIANISARLYNILKRNGINTIGEMIGFYESEAFINVKQMGIKTGQELAHLCENLVVSNQPAPLALLPDDSFKISSPIDTLESMNVRLRNILLSHTVSTIEDMIAFYRTNDSSSIKNMGHGTYSLFESICLDLISKFNMPTINTFGFIHSDYALLDISLLRLFGLSTREINHLKSKATTVGGLKNCDFPAEISTAIIEKIAKLNKPIEQFFAEDFFDILKGHEYFDYLEFRAIGFTLDEIAVEHNGCTRERIRQIVAKLVAKALPYVELFIFHALLEEEHFIRVSSVQNCISPQNVEAFIFLLENTKQFVYLEFAEVYLDISKCDELYSQLIKLADSAVCEIAFKDEVEKSIEESLDDISFSFMTAETIKNYLIRKKYRFYGEIVSKSRCSYGLICAKVVERHFVNGINFSNDIEVDALRDVMQADYPQIKLPDDNRSFKSRIVDNLVQRDSGKFIAASTIKVSQDLLDMVCDFINGRPETKIFAGTVFEHFMQEILQQSNIDNHYYLRAVIKHFYPDDYVWDTADYVGRKTTDGKVLSVYSSVRNYIARIGRAVHKDDIKSTLYIRNDTLLANAVASDANIFQWEHNYYNTKENLSVEDNDMEILHKILDFEISNNSGYLSEGMLFGKVQISMQNFMHRNGIANKRNLFYVAELLLGDLYDFRCPHIVAKALGLPSITAKAVVGLFVDLRQVVNHTRLIKLARRLKWPDGTANAVIANLLNDFIRLDENNFICKDAFVLLATHISEIDFWLKNGISRLGYISLANIMEFDGLPELPYDWNIHLLVSIISFYDTSFKLIFTSMSKRDSFYGVILPRSSEIETFEIFIASLLKADGKASLSESQLKNILQIKGFMNNRIPIECYDGDSIKFVNDKFILR